MNTYVLLAFLSWHPFDTSNGQDQYKRGETISDTDREQINVMTSLVFKLTEKQEEEAINRQEFIDALRKNEELMKVMKKF